MVKEKTFEVGTIVATTGCSIDQSGTSSQSSMLCKVIASGERDVLVKEITSSMYPSIFKIPKSLCTEIDFNIKKIKSERVMEPCLGDLVLSYSKGKFSTESDTSITGIVSEIVYSKGKPSRCTLLCDGEMKSVDYTTLMVIQSNLKK